MMFASGWTLEEVLDLSWEQLATVVGCMMSYKAEVANLVMEAVCVVPLWVLVRHIIIPALARFAALPAIVRWHA